MFSAWSVDSVVVLVVNASDDARSSKSSGGVASEKRSLVLPTDNSLRAFSCSVESGVNFAFVCRRLALRRPPKVRQLLFLLGAFRLLTETVQKESRMSSIKRTTG